MYLYNIFVIFCYLYQVNSYNKNVSCKNCKWFIKDKNNNPELGFCKAFKQFSIDIDTKEILLYEYSTHCRNNENLCGKNGYLYESNKITSKTDLHDIDTLIREYSIFIKQN